jgi:hypothetical protein
MNSILSSYRLIGLLLLVCSLTLVSCTKEELIQPANASLEQERSTFMEEQGVVGVSTLEEKGDDGRTLRNGEEGEGDGGGISDDGDDQGDKERNNKKN